MTGLLPYQIAPAEHLLFVLQREQAAVDFSMGGAGKTYVAIAVAKALNLCTLIVAPPGLRYGWERAAEHFGHPINFVGYEKLLYGNSGFGKWEFEGFQFHQDIQLVIFDEGHRCGGLETQSAEIMIAAKNQGKKILVLTATPACTPLQMRALGYALDLHNDAKPLLRPVNKFLNTIEKPDFKSWCRKFGCEWVPQAGGWKWGVSPAKQIVVMNKLRDELIPARGIRITLDMIPDFPDCDVRAELYDMDAEGELQRLSQIVAEALERHRVKVGNPNALLPVTERLYERQRIELLKLPVMADLARDYVAKGHSMALFVNFRESILELSKMLQTDCIIDGTVTDAPREANRLRFQRGKDSIILLNCQAGGVGIGLEDTTGLAPRGGLLFPGDSAVNFKQCLFRLPRSGGKGFCFYKIIGAARTVDEKVIRNLRVKLNNLDALIDGDLCPNNLEIAP